MKTRLTLARVAAAALISIGLSAPVAASDKTANTLIGAGLGAVAGSVLSDGDMLVTLGGAAAGGVLGNVLTEDRDYRRGWKGKKHWKGTRYDSPHRHYYVGGKHRGKGHYKHRGKGHHKHKRGHHHR